MSPSARRPCAKASSRKRNPRKGANKADVKMGTERRDARLRAVTVALLVATAVAVGFGLGLGIYGRKDKEEEGTTASSSPKLAIDDVGEGAFIGPLPPPPPPDLEDEVGSCDRSEEDGEVEEEEKDDEEKGENDTSADKYFQFQARDEWNYYPEEFEGDGRPANVCGDEGVDPNSCIEHGDFILSDFVVAGSNLAGYNMMHPKFQIFENFDIGPLIQGDEGWRDLIELRKMLQRPSLSWYADKVARKRWLHEQGHPQPKPYYLGYKSEISDSGRKEEEAANILEHLPKDRGFCAKPSHMCMGMGTWLIDRNHKAADRDDGDVKFTRIAKHRTLNERLDLSECADNLAEGLRRKGATASWFPLWNVEPGVVVEELWSDRIDQTLPPHEFNMFVVWGKFYVAQWNFIVSEGFFYKDRSPAPGCSNQEHIPDWVPWDELVELAETLGANKDMFRVDVFVGLPRNQSGSGDVRIAVNEAEITPTTLFCNPFIAEEMARLWVAGYKLGNYDVVPNSEVPTEYVKRQKQRKKDEGHYEVEADLDNFNQFPTEDKWYYYPEEFRDGQPFNVCGDEGVDPNECIERGDFILSDFVIAGSNLANFNTIHPKFQLFDTFDINPLIQGHEGWRDLLQIRNQLQRPSLSWYVDKVARKRWLREQGFPQPKSYYLKYKSEISDTNRKEDEVAEILKHLPMDRGFCAKPSHMAMAMGNWLVDPNPEAGDGDDNDVKFTREAKRLTSDERFDPYDVADSLAEGLQRKGAAISSWALRNGEPGVVVEELWSDHTDWTLPPQEFNMFVVWGKLYVGQWNFVGAERHFEGFFYRDRSPAPGCPNQRPIPDWVPWDELVELAETLGANKDMLRVDMFVGVPRHPSGDGEVRVAVNEVEFSPKTIFCNPFIADEMARLWVAGYKLGNYEVVPNSEVPPEYVEKQKRRISSGP
ncbi:hypothetical protein ACHAWF_013411 [Thalassiosira exigua]